MTSQLHDIMAAETSDCYIYIVLINVNLLFIEELVIGAEVVSVGGAFRFTA